MLNSLLNRLKNLAHNYVLFPIYFIKNKFYYGEWDHFSNVQIEISTYCNLRCTNCLNSKYEKGLLKNRKLMDLNLLEKILLELHEMNLKGGIILNSFSEPLTDERLPQIVEQVKKLVPKANINIISNGILLTPEKYLLLIKKGVDSFTVTQYAPKMPPAMVATFDFLKKNPSVKNLITYRIFKEIKGGICNWGGEIDMGERKLWYRPACAYPNAWIYIDVDGKVLLCCNDYHSNHTQGDINHEKIRDVWKKPSYKKIRSQIKKGIYELPICKRCMEIKNDTNDSGGEE